MLLLVEFLVFVLLIILWIMLFIRMEKMKVCRYFCEFEEIKLLKIVNGIYGLLVNCILLLKLEVEKYCLMYIDKLSEFN